MRTSATLVRANFTRRGKTAGRPHPLVGRIGSLDVDGRIVECRVLWVWSDGTTATVRFADGHNYVVGTKEIDFGSANH